MATVRINKFDGGMVQNKRLSSYTSTPLSIRVDTSRKQSIRPYKDFELDAVTESDLDNFGIHKILYTGAEFFGSGTVSTGNQKPQLYKKTTDSPTAVWTTETNGTNASSGARNATLFVYYKNQDTIYGGNAAGIWGYTVAGDTFTHNENTSVTPTGNGVVHSKDDILYVPCGAVIASKNAAGGWNNDAFTGLPSDFSSVSIAEHRNNLLVGGNRNKQGVLYVWDRDSSVATSVDSISFGDNTVKWVDTTGNLPIVCCTRVDATTGFNEVVFYAIDNSSPVELLSFNAEASGIAIVLGDTQKYGDSIQFLMELTIETELLVGIWSFVRKSDGTFKLEFVTTPRNDTAVTSGKVKGFFRYPGYHFICYLTEVSANTVWRTDDQVNYTATTRFHSIINPKMPTEDRIKKKQLLVVRSQYEAIPSTGTATIKYRIDGGSWVTLISETTAGVLTSEKQANSTLGTDIEFRSESTNGTEIVGLEYDYKVIHTQI
ncbi:MAG TPA: hypothetical protein ENI23_11220 [bacterium]|nr:hypothetical protein [bacterium]